MRESEKGQACKLAMDYDSLNRIIGQTNANGKTIMCNYDNMGKIRIAIAPMGNITITDSISGTISYTYTSTGCSNG